jgi:2-polyprenyl-3-methyl-5-hydroxy-6-metoxy-1,4-benzoquinol methylase
MSVKTDVYAAAAHIRSRREEWYQWVARDQGFVARGGKVYPYDITGANLDPLFELFESSGYLAKIESREIRSICDIGCANGELSFAFSRSGFDVTAVDYSLAHDQAPYMVSRLAARESMPVSVVDRSVDNYFDFADLMKCRVNPGVGVSPSAGFFDLAICVGLL